MAEAGAGQHIEQSEDTVCNIGHGEASATQDEVEDAINDQSGDDHHDEESDYIHDEQDFVKKSMQKNRTTIVQDLEPIEVLDVFLEDNFFGNDTIIRVRDIRDTANTSEKNLQYATLQVKVLSGIYCLRKAWY